MSGSFDVYQLPEEHRLLREVVRDLADTVIAPRAAEIDETAEFPHDVYKALVGAELHAPHIPEEYGGVGADAIAAAIVIEEIARACVVVLADPGGQQARHPWASCCPAPRS